MTKLKELNEQRLNAIWAGNEITESAIVKKMIKLGLVTKCYY